MLDWIIRGAAGDHQHGLSDPAAVRTATDAYARDQDTIGRFVDEHCHLAPGQTLVRVAKATERVSVRCPTVDPV